jgi:cobalamin biosynthesis protein CbiD
MKKLLVSLLSLALVTASVQAAENYVANLRLQAGQIAVEITNNTPYTIEYDARILIVPGQSKAVAVNTHKTAFDLYDEDGDLLGKVAVPGMLETGDDVTFLAQGGVVIVTHNGLPVTKVNVQ